MLTYRYVWLYHGADASAAEGCAHNRDDVNRVGGHDTHCVTLTKPPLPESGSDTSDHFRHIAIPVAFIALWIYLQNAFVLVLNFSFLKNNDIFNCTPFLKTGKERAEGDWKFVSKRTEPQRAAKNESISWICCIISAGAFRRKKCQNIVNMLNFSSGQIFNHRGHSNIFL